MSTKKVKILKSVMGSVSGLRKHERWYEEGEIYDVPSDTMSEDLAENLTTIIPGSEPYAEYTTAKSNTGKTKDLKSEEIEKIEKKHQFNTEAKLVKPKENK